MSTECGESRRTMRHIVDDDRRDADYVIAAVGEFASKIPRVGKSSTVQCAEIFCWTE
jgi:hypothetical protein